MVDAHELLNEQDVSTLTKVPRATLRAWRCRGSGPPFLRLSARTVRYRRDQVDAWLRSREVERTA
jgi:predicted DNA-binding transcriptional regulator AlpA